jgi:ribose transport system substrate-binding protein
MRGHANWAVLLASAASIAAPLAARADAYLDQAKAAIAKYTAPGGAWTGPTTGPAAQPGKLVVYVSTDQRNGGARGVGEGAAEAAKVLGWDFRTLDGQGTVSGRSAALNQAIALKPQAIVVGAIDAAEQAPVLDQAVKAGIVLVGWHAWAKPGPLDEPKLFTNISTDPLEVAKAAALYTVADSNGRAGVVIYTDSIYKIAIAKSDAMAAVVKACSGCKLLVLEDTPLGEASQRMPQLTTSLLSKFGAKWTYALAVNDLTFDFAAPSLEAAGLSGGDPPHNVSAGDGSQSAFQRIRQDQYQAGTVAEPLRLHGWEIADELNRAFAGAPPSGYVAPVHLFVHSNVNQDGGDKNVYDPGNGYRDAYRKIWGK